jgi:NAD(P)-dependent dehydrogenase (short-subunit alcohol dehydrogenase family)
MDLGLRNKAVLITGGERGIGRAIALGMAEEGCRVAIADHRLEKGPDSTLEELKSSGGFLARQVVSRHELPTTRRMKTRPRAQSIRRGTACCGRLLSELDVGRVKM